IGDEARRRTPARVTALASRTPRRLDVPAAPGSRRISFCPSCGARIAAGANYCAECGMGLRPLGRATGWSD
ncbi:MAG: zinc ribbon domain-containing protein, partial [Burkholderiales bacterium]